MTCCGVLVMRDTVEAGGVREIAVSDYFVVHLYQSDKWEGSVTWCQVTGGDEYQHGFFVAGGESEDSVAVVAVREAERWIKEPRHD